MTTTSWLTALSTACSVLYHRDASQPLPKWLNNYVINKLGNFVHGSKQNHGTQHKEHLDGIESEHPSDSSIAPVEKEDVVCQLLYNIYTVLSETKAQEKEQISDVNKSNHWKRVSRIKNHGFSVCYCVYVSVSCHSHAVCSNVINQYWYIRNKLQNGHFIIILFLDIFFFSCVLTFLLFTFKSIYLFLYVICIYFSLYIICIYIYFCR